MMNDVVQSVSRACQSRPLKKAFQSKARRAMGSELLVDGERREAVDSW
jgi:hypothetical protein